MFSNTVFLMVALALATGLAAADTFTFESFANPAYPDNTVAMGMNDIGQIVGEYASSEAVFTSAFMYQNGVFTTINFPNANYTVATGINNAGDIVGYYADSSAKVHGFTYYQGSFTTIDSPNAVGTWISGINDNGQLVGYYSDTSSVFHGLIYDKGTLTTVDDPNAGVLGSTKFFGINNARQIVGEASSPVNGASGFVYKNGQFGALVDASNGKSPTPAGINDLGEIGGTAVLNGLTFGFTDVDGKFTYFSDPAYTFTTVCVETCMIEPIPIQVSGINDIGEILGFHSYIDITTPVVYSFIATSTSAAVPEPRFAGMFAAGIVAIGLLELLRRRARRTNRSGV